MTEVVQPYVVGARVAADVRESISFRHPLHPAPYDDRELALVVEELGPPRTPEHTAVPVQGRRRLDEVRRLRRRARRVLVYAAAIGQVDREDLGRLYRRQIPGLRLRDPTTPFQNDLSPLEPTPRRPAFVQDPYPSSHSVSFLIGYIIQKRGACQDTAGHSASSGARCSVQTSCTLGYISKRDPLCTGAVGVCSVDHYKMDDLCVPFHAVLVCRKERVPHTNTPHHFAAPVQGDTRALYPPPSPGLRRAARASLAPRRESRALRAARARARRRRSGAAARVGRGRYVPHPGLHHRPSGRHDRTGREDLGGPRCLPRGSVGGLAVGRGAVVTGRGRVGPLLTVSLRAHRGRR